MDTQPVRPESEDLRTGVLLRVSILLLKPRHLHNPVLDHLVETGQHIFPVLALLRPLEVVELVSQATHEVVRQAGVLLCEPFVRHKI